MSKQLLLDVHRELIVDLFAGGGGMSTAFEKVLGRSPDIAINHDDDALSMHRINHPQTRHFIADVFEVCPRGATQGRPVGWLHLSPDCTHHSQAAGGQPRNKKIRGLSWVGYRWAGQVKPRIISLENVPQILKWGPLIAKRDKATGRVIRRDGTVAAVGERIPVQDQYLIPDPKHEGRTWRRFVRALEALGYVVKHDVSVAADLGGHTTRKRLFMVARRDGEPIVMPTQTHAKTAGQGLPKWKPAADGLDFTIPCPSIFTRKKPLAEATMRRIARGIVRYVLQNPAPFIVPIAHYNGRDTAHPTTEPLRTVTAATKGGEFSLATPVLAKFRADSDGAPVDGPLPTVTSGGAAKRPAGAPHALGLIAPTLVQAGHGEGTPNAPRWSYGTKDIQQPLGTVTASAGGHAMAAATLVQIGYGERDGQAPRSLDLTAPLGTVVGSGKHALASALLVGVGGRAGQTEPKTVGGPANTCTAKADTGLVTAYLAQMNGGFNTTPGHGADEPASTITNSGSQQQLVAANLCTFSPEDEAGALRVAAFLMRYYGEGGQWSGCDEPMPTATTRDRLALVTVTYQGTPYLITDIGLRMLVPRELYNCNDFPRGYIIDRGHDGRKFSKSAQVRMAGNSVDPVQGAAYIAANATEMAVTRRVAA